MSSGVPRGGGKNQHSDNVNMASNDGKLQNLPRGGSKNQASEHANMPTNDGKMPGAVRATANNQYYPMGNVAPNDPAVANIAWGGHRNQYIEPPNMNANEAMMHNHRITQPHYAQVPVPVPTSMQPSNPTIYSNGSLRQDGPSSYFLQVAPSNPPTMQTQPNYGYSVANNYPMHPPYNGSYFSQPAYSYPATHSQQPYAPSLNVPTSEVAPVQSSAPAVPRAQRERKPLLIVDPTTQNAINIVPSKSSSANTTPNTTVDADVKEEVKNAFRKDFSAQVQNKIENDKKETDGQTHIHPVAQSEAKDEPVLEDNNKEVHVVSDSKENAPDTTPTIREEVETDVQPISDAAPAIIQENNGISDSTTVVDPSPNQVIIEESAAAEEIVSENTPQPSVPHVDDGPSLQIAPAEADISPSISVEQVPECEEEETALSPSPDQEEDTRIQEEEEEGERIRLREIELDNLLEELEKDSKECNESIGFYGRKFLYCVRDIEKEFKRTEPPVTLDQLKNTYGIDIQSMPKSTDKKRTDFNPSWVKNTMGQGPRPYPGRPSREHRSGGRGGGGGNKNKPFTGRPSIDRPPKVQLINKAEHAWRPEKDKDKKIEELDGEENKIKALLKAVRSLLNKITPTTKDDLIKEFLTMHVSGQPPHFNAPEGQLAQVIDVIFDKAVDEPKFCSLYSEICKRQVDSELKVAKNSAFRNALLNRSQNTFVNKTMEANKTAIDNETDEEKKKDMMLKYEDDFNKFRRRKFGNINFIGQLYYQTLLSTKIIQWCLFDLLRHSHPDTQGNLPEPPYDEESIHCATQLVEAVGKTFESCKDFEGANTYLSQIFDHMLKIAPKCSPKIRFKILGVKELRDNNWRQRKVVDQGPKKITEIHKEIQAEQQQLIMERDAYERKQGQGVRQGSNSLRRSAAPPSRNSLDSRASNPQNKRAVAGTASKLVPTSAGTPRQMSLSISGGTQKKANWKTGSGGGGNSEGPGSRTIIQRNSGSREGSESRKNSTMAERDSALQAAREIGGNAVNRSNSQISIVSQEDNDRNEAENERQKKIEKVANKVECLLEELIANETSEQELIDELFGLVESERNGMPELNNIFQQYVRAFITMKPHLRAPAAKILYKCLLKPGTKSSVIKGIEDYCHWAIQEEAWEENANLWDLLADLLVRVLLTVPEAGESEDSKRETKATTLDDFSPVFLAASCDDRPNKTYSLLILTLKQMAEQLAKENIEMIAGIAMDFQELTCCKVLDSVKLETALKRCNPDVPEFDNLFDLVHH